MRRVVWSRYNRSTREGIQDLPDHSTVRVCWKISFWASSGTTPQRKLPPGPTEVWLLCTPCTSSAVKSFSSLIKITSSNSLFVVIYSLSPLAEPASHPGGEQRECAKVANSGAWCERKLLFPEVVFTLETVNQSSAVHCNSFVPLVRVWTLGVWSLRLSFKSPQ